MNIPVTFVPVSLVVGMRGSQRQSPKSLPVFQEVFKIFIYQFILDLTSPYQSLGIIGSALFDKFIKSGVPCKICIL